MAITRVNGTLLRRMVVNGAINLKNNYQEIDQLNVFPVPDGDTGTNMQMTMMAGVKEIESIDVKSMSQLGKTLSRGLLMGARGNSGVILSQFFRGVYMSLKNVTSGSISLSDFADCLKSGYQTAYKAVMEPVEGTILTVVREASLKVTSEMANIFDLEKLLQIYLAEAKSSLQRTPDLLPVLKEAGVVDSGGAGFVKIVEGMLMAVQGKKLTVKSEKDASDAKNFDQAEIKYGYCTEFIVELREPDKFDENELRDTLLRMGDSLVLVQDEHLLKVHVHSNEPGVVLTHALSYGEIVTTKIENMRRQHTSLIESKKEVPKPRQKYAIISVCFGEGIKQAFRDLGSEYIIDGGQTMNPATEDFVKAIDHCNADNVLIIPNNSNVILAAEQATKLVENVNVKVLKAKTIAQGYSALIVFDSNQTLDQNYEDMMGAIGNMKSGEVTYAVRDTEINGVVIKSGDFMGINRSEIVCSLPSRVDATKGLLDKLVDEDSQIVTVFYGNDVSEEEVNGLRDYVQSMNKNLEIEIVSGKQDIYSYIIAVE